ncbi:hypothetical protein BKA66DRAFT_447657 [Pyrenochaeta sp. MPI-SDFR-AT-0127]|nr:hypothetical protein BKA66DRAFT_447657 [Pyrenochaeta sp. MPI-SDFR-AT-0127]
MPRILASLLFALSLAGIQAQSTTPFTDAATGITFQQYSTNGFSFGIALPEEAGTDFIGRISAETTGWAGITLTGSMRNSVLAVAWPVGDSVISTLRSTTGYSNPALLDADATIKPILTGTSVSATGFTYTFLCQGCIVAGKAFDVAAESGVLGWALSTSSPTTPSSASSPLSFHDGGFGGFGFDLAGAKSANFATWAALASSGNSTVPPPPSGGGNNSTTPVTVSNSTYDYIVVGGGASGLVVSQRLAETGKSVLVLERGGPSFYSSGGRILAPWNDTLTVFEVPGLFNALPRYIGASGYCSDTPEVAGCILGGGTTVNGLQFVRPPTFDFDDKWPQGWKWSDMEAAAARLYERNPGDTSPSVDGKYYDNAVWDVMSKLLDSAGWKHVDTNEQPDEKFQIYSYPSINTINGLRAGPVRTYLPLAAGLSNFELQLHTKVIRTVRTNSTIAGVEVENAEGKRIIINVNQGGKVILAAGAMSSPRLLFNSGIGPTDQINIVKSGNTGVTLPPESAWINLPVGHVRDHALLTMRFNVAGNLTIMAPEEFTNPSDATKALYAQGSGPLAQSFNRGMMYNTITNADGHKTLTQTHFSSFANNTVTFLTGITHGSTSTGTLGITPDGNGEWTVNPYLNTASDKEALARAIDEILAISRQTNSTISYSGSANATGASIIASSNIQAGAHMTGTTIMGTDDGTKGGSSVVDLNCKVYGTDNLFIVDAGMHPDLPTGNTQAIVMVAAEKAVEKIIALGDGTANETGTNPVEGAVSSVGTLEPTVVVPTSSAQAVVSTSVQPVVTTPIGSTPVVVSTLKQSTVPVPSNGGPVSVSKSKWPAVPKPTRSIPIVPSKSKRPVASATSTSYRGRPVRGAGKGRWGWQ